MSPSWEATSFSATQQFSQHFREPEGSLPCSQEPPRVPILSQIECIWKDNKIRCENILLRVCGDYYKTGIGLTTGFIRSHTQLHTITVYTLHNSQQLSLLSSTEDLGSNSATTAATNSYALERTPKKTLLRFPYCWNDVISGTDRKENADRFHCCVAWQRLVNKRLTVDCWPTACTSQYLSFGSSITV
jgi:hypothetical protein